jgi:hypothetical protein
MKLGFLVEGSGTKHLRELDASNRVNAKVEIHTFLFVRKPFQSQEDYEMGNDCCTILDTIFVKLCLRGSLFLFSLQKMMKSLWEKMLGHFFEKNKLPRRDGAISSYRRRANGQKKKIW